jgi:PAS domain S-box-containing protein
VSEALRRDLRLAIDTIPTIVWSTTPDGTVDFMNRAWRDFTGISLGDVRRGRWTDSLHPDEAGRVREARDTAIRLGSAYEFEARLRRADGSYRWVLRRAVPLRDEHGTIVRWYGVGTDIDDLKRTEVALRESEAYLADAQRLSHTGSFGWDLARSELRWSDETFRIFDYDPAEAPTIDHMLRRVHPADMARVLDAIDRVTHAPDDWELDHRLLMPNGRVKHVHVVARATRHASGVGVAFIGAVMDVTAMRKAQRAVRRARERTLEARYTAALEERTRLAREIHDTLLQGFTGVGLQLAAIARRVDDPKTATALDGVMCLAQRSLNDARQAIWDLRTPAPVGNTLAVVLRQAAEDAVHGTDLTLTYEVLGAELPLGPEIEAAASRVMQEAIANTIKHAGANTVLVRVHYRARCLGLSVTDDGIGFDVDPALRANGGHWGLLGIKERASELGATLSVRSTRGGGTTVAIRIPYRATPSVMLGSVSA